LRSTELFKSGPPEYVVFPHQRHVCTESFMGGWRAVHNRGELQRRHERQRKHHWAAGAGWPGRAAATVPRWRRHARGRGRGRPGQGWGVPAARSRRPAAAGGAADSCRQLLTAADADPQLAEGGAGSASDPRGARTGSAPQTVNTNLFLLFLLLLLFLFLFILLFRWLLL